MATPPIPQQQLDRSAAWTVCMDAIAKGDLLIWTVYDSPTDHPGKFIARPFSSLLKKAALPVYLSEDDLEDIRDVLRSLALTCLARDPKDDPKIVETWI